jgi:3-oxoacyl-[acyl-carrier protein] reductase
MRLPNKVALITGAGSGIGRATAQLFAREGAKVVLADLRKLAGRETLDGIKAAGGEAIFVEADVSNGDDVKRMIDTCVASFGRIDILYNNAGIAMQRTPIEEIDDALFDRIIAVNVRSVHLGARHAVPHMKRQGGGVILNTGSTAGIRPRVGASSYAASKGAVIALTKALALELAPFRIRVVSINPVAVDTPMLHGIAGGQVEGHTLEAYLASIPMGRLNRAEDVANAALYLASDEAFMVTGTAFEVDGGRDI